MFPGLLDLDARRFGLLFEPFIPEESSRGEVEPNELLVHLFKIYMARGNTLFTVLLILCGLSLKERYTGAEVALLNQQLAGCITPVPEGERTQADLALAVMPTLQLPLFHNYFNAASALQQRERLLYPAYQERLNLDHLTEVCLVDKEWF